MGFRVYDGLGFMASGLGWCRVYRVYGRGWQMRGPCVLL